MKTLKLTPEVLRLKSLRPNFVNEVVVYPYPKDYSPSKWVTNGRNSYGPHFIIEPTGEVIEALPLKYKPDVPNLKPEDEAKMVIVAHNSNKAKEALKILLKAFEPEDEVVEPEVTKGEVKAKKKK